MKKALIVFISIFAAVITVCRPGVSHALPFNDDMVDSPVLTGKIMRPAPDGSVAVGSLGNSISNRDDALKLTNPIKGDKVSILSGKRLFQVNCTPCHGDIESNPYVPGKVAKFLPGPNLSVAMYQDKAEGRTDGSIYGTIHFGSISGLMPAVGWKLSPTEHWDIINYIRTVQDKSK